MTVYARRTGDFPGASVDTLLAASIAFAIPGGLVAGVLVQRVGPKRVLTATLLLVAAALLLAGLSGSGAMLWVAGPAVGIAFGAVWTSDRVFLVRLCPEERRGEAFGLYTLVGKASSGIGPVVLWGGTILLLSGSLGEYGASRVAVCLLAVAALGASRCSGRCPTRRACPPSPPTAAGPAMSPADGAAGDTGPRRPSDPAGPSSPWALRQTAGLAVSRSAAWSIRASTPWVLRHTMCRGDTKCSSGQRSCAVTRTTSKARMAVGSRRIRRPPGESDRP
ncbi:MAG: MFS transporter [Thermoleophilaceae bacterium]